MNLARTKFGPDGPVVTRVGLGGEGVLRTFGRHREARAVIGQALDLGLAYFDSAAVYAGSESYYGLVWPDRLQDRAGVFQASKSAQRLAPAAANDLDNTLSVMGLDYLDLWQIHDIRDESDLQTIGGPGGALEAFVKAKEAGKVRFIGVTGHYDPEILDRAVSQWPVDAVLLPVNPVEACLGGFMDRTISLAKERGLAVIAMKALGAGHYPNPAAGVTAETLICFALSQPVDVVIVGCRNRQEVKILAEAAVDFMPLSPEEQERLIDLYRPHVRRLAYYRGWI